MTFKQLLLALRARLAIVLVVLVVTVATTLGVSLWLPKQYAAATAVLVDVKSLDPVTGAVLPGMFQPGYMSTQIDIINSNRVANRVVQMLQWPADPARVARWQAITEGQGDYAAWAARVLQARLDVKPSRDSNVITIGYSGTDPDEVAAIANAFAKAYVETVLELKVEPARQSALWFEAQARQARTGLEESQRKLSDFQQRHGILATDERLDVETGRLNELSTQLTSLQNQVADVQSRRLAPSADAVADVMQSPLVNSTKAEIGRLEARIQENSGNYGENHPQAIRAKAELQVLKGRLAAEIGQIRNALETAYQVGRQREQQLGGALEAQREKVLQLNRQRTELNVLRRELEAAQRSFETVSQRLAQTLLESQSAQTNVSVLNLATPPVDPFKPRVAVNVLASVLVGTLLGLGVALVLELGNRRIRSMEDLSLAIDVPVLAHVRTAATAPRLKRPRSRRAIGHTQATPG
ncbi:chain length determinant protein EpsF [Pseudorhodoferax sp.]|uniref:chain length determinant protein EpsF n=1 Tax=Pseudorhodoferax sp. TaxID=1993553 RepID=UPI002DD689D0|nr:chain length determinant protein EpsF [Pseudorhodoferax sp.]